MKHLSTTIPPGQIRTAGEPVFPHLRRFLVGEHSVLLPFINEREQYGMSKYGQTLLTDDGRDTPTEIVNEVLDLLAYLTKWHLQTQDKKALAMLRQALDLATAIVQIVNAE